MAQRYSRILSAAKYYAAVDNYLKYITDATRRGSRVGLGDPRPKSIPLFIRPFGIDLAVAEFAKASGAEPTWNTHKASIGTRAKDALAAGNTALRLDDFQPARVIITTGRSATGVAKTSKTTGMKYLDYGGKSTSLPFGEDADTDDQTTAFTAIRTAILAAAGGTALSVTLKPEKL